MDRVVVGIGEWSVLKLNGVLVCLGLGSCVGVALYDSSKKMGGLAHILLPRPQVSDNSNPTKFASTGIPFLLEEMIRLGASKSSLLAKIAGGSQMFSIKGREDKINIGARNVEVAKDTLKDLGIPIVGEDTGGSMGRTIEFYVSDGTVKIKAIGRGERKI
ncbi:TPA: chemotaxis protein CheD [bacterium]|jgi:chemotaxis protein CheD|nr:chemotaxis protein CheD [bacterium]